MRVNFGEAVAAGCWVVLGFWWLVRWREGAHVPAAVPGLRWLPGQAHCSRFPPSFLLRETGFGAFLCSPSEGLPLFSCLMSVSLLFGPGVVQAGPTPPFWGLGRCGCSCSGAAAQLVLVSRGLAAVWDEKNTNTTIKWQDGACYRIKSGFMIFDLHLVFMCAELHCDHRHTATSPMGHPQDGDGDGHLSSTSTCVGKEPGAHVLLQVLMTPPSLHPSGLQFCPFYYQHQCLPPAPLCSLLLFWWLKSQPSAGHLLLLCPSSMTWHGMSRQCPKPKLMPLVPSAALQGREASGPSRQGCMW